MLIFSAQDYALARSRPRERPKIIARPNVDQETFAWIRSLMDLILPDNFKLLPPKKGWGNKELYLTYRPPGCPDIFGRMYLDVTAAGVRKGKNNFRTILIRYSGPSENQDNTPKLVWKFNHIRTDRPYSTVLRQRTEAVDLLGRSWEPCPFHRRGMNLRVNPTNGYLEWHCQTCDGAATIASLVRSAVRRQTPRDFWQSRKQ